LRAEWREPIFGNLLPENLFNTKRGPKKIEDIEDFLGNKEKPLAKGRALG